MRFSKAVEQMDELGVNNNRFGFGVIEDVAYVFGLEPVVDSYPSVSKQIIYDCSYIAAHVPTFTALAPAMPYIDSKNAGVFGHNMPTRLYPCFFK